MPDKTKTKKKKKSSMELDFLKIEFQNAAIGL